MPLWSLLIFWISTSPPWAESSLPIKSNGSVWSCIKWSYKESCSSRMAEYGNCILFEYSVIAHFRLKHQCRVFKSKNKLLFSLGSGSRSKCRIRSHWAGFQDTDLFIHSTCNFLCSHALQKYLLLFKLIYYISENCRLRRLGLQDERQCCGAVAGGAEIIWGPGAGHKF